MKAVHKYALLRRVTVVNMPEGAEVLHCAEQRKVLCLWALVDPDLPPTRARMFARLTTGEQAIFTPCQYVGTVIMDDGGYVEHVFEVTP